MRDMDNEYKNISVEELLLDDYFRSSILTPSAESDIFWDKLLADGDIDPVCFAQARDFLLLLTFPSRQFSVREERIKVLRERINRSVAPEKSKTSLLRGLRRSNTLLWPVVMMVSAACIAVALFLRPAPGERVQDELTINGTPIAAMSSEAGADIITLSFGDKKIEMEGDEAYLDYSSGNLKINEQKIDNSASPKEDLNTLAVPFGKRSMVSLSDGSRLWVNAGTKVVYPNKFTGNRREIYVNGEVYAEITHNPANPFMIKTTKGDVTVLGTTLNVNAYETEKEIAVVLVAGMVSVTNRNGVRSDLTPNQIYFESDGEYYVRRVNVENHISWKDGIYKYSNERIENIVKQLSKYYNVRIHASSAAGRLTCSGELVLKEELTKVLKGICETTQIVYRRDAESGIYYLD